MVVYDFPHLRTLNKALDGSEIENLAQTIEVISSYVVPEMLETFKDPAATVRTRNAAGKGLLRVDKKKVVDLSVGFLGSDNEETLTVAITNLTEAKSREPYKKIAAMKNHPSVVVRKSVESYLKNYKTWNN